LGKVRNGEVRGDLVGKAAPGRKPKSDCTDNKQEKYGASMAASMIRKSGHRFSEKIMLQPKTHVDLEKSAPVFRKDLAPLSARHAKKCHRFFEQIMLRQKLEQQSIQFDQSRSNDGLPRSEKIY
jgi:hypothetical protein